MIYTFLVNTSSISLNIMIARPFTSLHIALQKVIDIS
jgi:hypothetical protein